MRLNQGSIDQSVYFKWINPTTGVPVTGLDVTTLVGSYVRDRALRVGSLLTLLGSVDASHTDWGAIEVDAVNSPGLYRVDYPNGAFASGVDRVQLIANGAGIDPAYIEVELNPVSASDVVAEVTTDSASRIASQADISTLALEASVGAIPTNPLLTTDSRIDALALEASVQAIPVNPLTSTDSRLDNLDASISSRATQLSVDAVATQASIDALNDISTSDILNATIEGAETLVQAIRLMRSALLGVGAVSGDSYTFRDAGNTKNRITATVDENGNRTSVTVDGV